MDVRWFGVVGLIGGGIGFYLDREKVKEFYKKCMCGLMRSLDKCMQAFNFFHD
jgi:hypothetical protein